MYNHIYCQFDNSDTFSLPRIAHITLASSDYLQSCGQKRALLYILIEF